MPKAWSKKDERMFDHVKESELDRGSEFWVELPRFAGVRNGLNAPRADESHGALLADGESGRIKIVYVEDNPANVAFMQQLLGEFERVELLTATSAEIGIELIRRVRPNAVIMDINLPGMSGFDATRRLREWPETRDIPVIGLSSAAMPRDRRRAAPQRWRAKRPMVRSVPGPWKWSASKRRVLS